MWDILRRSVGGGTRRTYVFMCARGLKPPPTFGDSLRRLGAGTDVAAGCPLQGRTRITVHTLRGQPAA